MKITKYHQSILILSLISCFPNFVLAGQVKPEVNKTELFENSFCYVEGSRLPKKQKTPRDKMEALIKGGDENKINNLWSEIEKEPSNEEQKLKEKDFVAFLAFYGHESLLNKFLEKGGDVNFAICGAARAGNKDLVNQLLNKEANINIAVAAAAAENQILLANNLLNRGASLLEAIEGALLYNYKIKQEGKELSNVSFLDTLFFEREKDLRNYNITKLASIAALLGDEGTINRLINTQGFYFQELSLKQAIITSAFGDNPGLLERLLYKEKDRDYAVYVAADFHKEKIMWDLLKLGASKDEAIRAIKSKDKIDTNLIEKIQNFKQ